MRERLIELRKYFDLPQREFCSRFSMTQSTYAPLETGKRAIRDTYAKLICQAYNVNEKWFRTGQGAMFNEEPDRELEELLKIYDELSPALKTFLVKHAKDLRNLQEGLNI